MSCRIRFLAVFSLIMADSFVFLSFPVLRLSCMCPETRLLQIPDEKNVQLTPVSKTASSDKKTSSWPRCQPRPSLRFPPPSSPPRKLRLSRNPGILPSSQESATPPRSRFLRADTASAARSRPHRFPPHELPRPSCRATPSPAIGTPLHIFRLFSGKPALSTLRFPGNGSNVWAPLRLYYAGTSCLRTGNVWKRFFLPFCSWLSARFLPVSSPCGR